MSNNELMHYGKKGMKWGKRRFQYEDGGLTPAGKKRYDVQSSQARKKKITNGTGNLSKGSKISSNSPVGLKDRKPVEVKEGKNEREQKVISSLKNSGINWNKYSKTSWYSKKGVSGLVDELIYNVDGLKNKKFSLSNVLDYFENDYGLTSEDAKTIVQVALKNSIVKKKEQDGKPKNIQLTHSDDELRHYGVLGQKWGVRRYRNRDGSLTSAGRKRYNKISIKRNNYHKGDRKKITDEELQKRIKRLELEKRYNDLLKDPKKINTGKDRVKKILEITGTAVTVGISATTLISNIRRMKKEKGSAKSSSIRKLEEQIKTVELEKKLKDLKKGG